jgi:DNA-directed RNA polymerase I subunit RPA2
LLLLKALKNTSDKELYEAVPRLEMLSLIEKHNKEFPSVVTQAQALKFLGGRFKKLLKIDHMDNVRAGIELLQRYVVPHLSSGDAKFDHVLFMLSKLIRLVAGEIKEDSPDSPMNQELLLPGAIMSCFVREKLEDYLATIEKSKGNFDLGRKLEHFLSTGTYVSRGNVGIVQSAGYVVVAEKLNFWRYLSHYRSVHRGQVFTEMKTTAVRRLLPDAWGFLCPVHTPDGAPCGLLNHLSTKCVITTLLDSDPAPLLKSILLSLGLVEGRLMGNAHYMPIMVDGHLLGYLDRKSVKAVLTQVRREKAKHKILNLVEMAFIPDQGVFFFSSMARMMRPVLNLDGGGFVEYIGTLEQLYMDIACLDADVIANITTHREIAPTNMLSEVASFTPFSDYNQSPRNMYQCQMGKQTMATASHNLPFRADNKTYRISYPTSPLVRTRAYDAYGIDDYPMGHNAVVAVISYTGYDMEDAMIINKSAFDRGMFHGYVYQTVTYEGVVEDLPEPGDVYISKFNEKGYIHDVKVYSGGAKVRIRFDRRPVLGDKFSSRHGQKGTLAQLWPTENMPFASSGIVPDVIINPNAFPSRMTIGMLIESMAAKAGALHGKFVDATPFEGAGGYETFGEMLAKAGYDYHGNEMLYSGTLGVEMSCDIYIGCVYYQRLRHMVKDKFQVRSTGPIHDLTHQPIKGRKMGGGIRFGEMERDSLLGHGVAYLLADRLLHSSDEHKVQVCRRCKSFIGVVSRRYDTVGKRRLECSSCGSVEETEQVTIPYVFNYLVNELAAMGVRVQLETAANSKGQQPQQPLPLQG